jgi:hypothetical protein
MRNLEPFDLDNATYRKPGGGYVCGFGGSSSSSSPTTTQTTNIDKRLVTDNGATAISADNSTITMTDNGAVKAALDSSTTNFSTLLDTVKVLGAGAVNSLQANVQLAKDLNSGTQSAYADAANQASGNKTLLYGGLAVLAMVGLSIAMKKAG